MVLGAILVAVSDRLVALPRPPHARNRSRDGRRSARIPGREPPVPPVPIRTPRTVTIRIAAAVLVGIMIAAMLLIDHLPVIALSVAVFSVTAILAAHTAYTTSKQSALDNRR